MLTSEKRQPAYRDIDLMPFGKYKNEPLEDVPASYLAYLYREMFAEYSKIKITTWSALPEVTKARILLFNYIWNSKEAIEQDTGESDDEGPQFN